MNHNYCGSHSVLLLNLLPSISSHTHIHTARFRQDTYVLTQFALDSKSTRQQKKILTFSKSKPDIAVQPVSKDPRSPNFTAFNIISASSGEILCTLRADDIVQQRKFMAALGGKGPGLFTQSHDGQSDTSARAGKQSIDLAKELHHRQQSFTSLSNDNSTKQNKLPTYAGTLEKLPAEFYFPNDSYQQALRSRSSKLLPLYNPSLSSSNIRSLEKTPVLSSCQASKSDSFRPPHGTPVFSPAVLGYGEEVGLEPHQQVIWDPVESFYYFLDHQKKTTFVNDPWAQRKHLKRVERQDLLYQPDPQEESRTLAVFTEVCTIPEVVEATSSRAAQTEHAFVLKCFGHNGKPGRSGSEGEQGGDGTGGQMAVHYGESGVSGDDGGHGMGGQDGMNGSNGVNGRDVILELSGDTTKLCVANHSCSFSVKLGGEESEGVLLVDCRGGRGGDGGRGGFGGRGGNGGDGGKGALGGDGGHGGDGGMGGDGGRGGRGGQGGNGGRCVIEANDPRLLMLVEVDCRGGVSGKGSDGGKRGSGGKGGFGGEGGGGESPGLRGKPGMTGPNGRDGDAGCDGLHGQDGGILWVVKSPNENQPLCKAATRFEPKVVSLNVTHCPPSCHNADDTFHPNERIAVSEITVVNSGGMPLPAGAQLSIPSTETIQFELTTVELPALAPGEETVVQATFHGRIFDQASPNSPGPFHSHATFAPRISLLGRPFKNTTFEQKLTVLYPVNLAFVLSKRSVASGEVTTLEIGIQNTSQLPFGTSNGCPNSAGSVAVQVHLDCRLIPLGLFGGELNPEQDDHLSSSKLSRSNSAQLPYKATYDPTVPDSLWVDITELQPSETLIIPIATLLSEKAEICDTCFWQADLYFRGKLVEYGQSEISVSPAYSPPQSPSQLSDVLMITTHQVTGEERVYWQRIFEIAGVSVDYWNADYQKPEDEDGFNTSTPPQMPPFKHLYRRKLIVYPYCDLNFLPAEDIVSHFHGSKSSSGSVPHGEDLDLGSSMVLFLSPTKPSSLKEYINKRQGLATVLKHLCKGEAPVELPPSAYSGYHLLAPGTLVPSEWSVKEREKGVIRKLEKESPSQSLTLFARRNVIRHQGACQYSYGTLDIRRCPLLRSCNFQCADGAGGCMTAMGKDDPLLTTTTSEISLASNFGQVLLSLLSGLPIRCKLALLKPTSSLSSAAIQFHLPNGLTLSRAELAAICIANEIAEELQSCSGNISRMMALMEDLKSHPTSYSGSTTTILQLVELIKTEVGECKKLFAGNTQVSKAVKEVHGCCNTVVQVLKCLSNAGTAMPTVALPPLWLLQDSYRVVRCHKLTDDTKYIDFTSS